MAYHSGSDVWAGAKLGLLIVVCVLIVIGKVNFLVIPHIVPMFA
jgi:hypothetical protein